MVESHPKEQLKLESSDMADTFGDLCKRPLLLFHPGTFIVCMSVWAKLYVRPAEYGVGAPQSGKESTPDAAKRLMYTMDDYLSCGING